MRNRDSIEVRGKGCNFEGQEQAKTQICIKAGRRVPRFTSESASNPHVETVLVLRYESRRKIYVELPPHQVPSQAAISLNAHCDL